MKVMIVDDSRLVHELVGGMFRDPGTEVLHADNGWQALKLLSDHLDLDVILLDINMPEVHGLAFLKLLRARSECDRIAVLIVSTEKKPEAVKATLAAGAQGYVHKPFEKDELLEAIATACRRVTGPRPGR